MKPRIPRRLKEYSPRDLLIVGLPLLILVIAGFWLASRYIRPAPPDTLIISTGGEGGAYQRFGAAYKDVLARYGIQVTEEASAGSTENLARLRDPEHAVDAAFIQGGTARALEDAHQRVLLAGVDRLGGERDVVGPEVDVLPLAGEQELGGELVHLRAGADPLGDDAAADLGQRHHPRSPLLLLDDPRARPELRAGDREPRAPGPGRGFDRRVE
jgi:hypothetical protein